MIGHRGENLIFLVSQPRSGSTLLQRVLAGHRAIHTTAEPWIALAPCLAAGTPGLAKDALLDFCDNIPGGMESYWTAASGFLRELYNSALYRSDRGDSSPKLKFLDKTPRYYSILPELKTMFPEAKFILLLRNPLAVYASIAKAWGGVFLEHMSEFRQDLYDAPAQLLWGMKNLPNLTVVHYENFVECPEADFHRICLGLGINPSAACLDYGKTPAPFGRMGDTLVNDHTRPVTDSLNKWEWLRDWNVSANLYLNNLDAQVCAELGYPLNSLREQLNQP